MNDACGFAVGIGVVAPNWCNTLALGARDGVPDANGFPGAVGGAGAEGCTVDDACGFTVDIGVVAPNVCNPLTLGARDGGAVAEEPPDTERGGAAEGSVVGICDTPCWLEEGCPEL